MRKVLKDKTLIFILFFAYSIQMSGNDEIKRGLYFHSFEVDKDKRTCLDLTPNKPLNFSKGFSLSFDINLRNEEHTYGYVFRIIDNDTLNIDFITKISAQKDNFSLIIQQQTVIHFDNSEIGVPVENTWLKVLLVFDPVAKTISVSINGVKKEAAFSSRKMNRFRIYFGGNMHSVFSTTDIAPMIVKDIRLFNHKNELARHWELAKHATDCVYDECVSDKATVINPVWEIDLHAKWNKNESWLFDGQSYHIAYDRQTDRVYFARNTSLYEYDYKEQRLDTIGILSGIPFNNQLSNQLVYDPDRHVLISYDFENKRLAFFNFYTNTWSNNDNTEIAQKFSHHCRLIPEGKDILLTFGGYGFHQYNSILNKCNILENEWDSIDLKQSIPPRYLAGMGLLDDNKVLVFGGFGNESGIQEEFPRNFYDLYTIDIEKNEVKKIWELTTPKEHFTNSNSLVIDQKNRKFYGLAYPNKRYASFITLHEYNLDAPECRVVGDTIPYYFNDIGSFCNLFQSSDNTEIYAITSYVRNNNTDVQLFSIAFPPLDPDATIQHPPSATKRKSWLLLWLIPCLLIVALSGLKKHQKKSVSGGDHVEQVPEKEEEPVFYDHVSAEKRPSSIYLLGNFQVIDNKGNDITKNFTPTTTQLFLLLLMSTIKNGQGITSKELKKILWSDKDDDSARNNRNVYINKLRSLLKKFGEIKVVNQESYWSLQYGKDVFCDFERMQVLMKTLQSADRFSIKLLSELVDLAFRGTLLPYTQQPEWLETYQSDYGNRLIESLIEFSKRDEVKKDLLLLLKIADVILLHDNIEEDAIKIKCYALYRLGRKNLAINAFNKFTADYESLLAAKHNLIFDDLVKSL